MGKFAAAVKRMRFWSALLCAMSLLGACSRTIIGPNIDHGQFETYFQSFLTDATGYHRDIADHEDVLIEFGQVNTPTAGSASSSGGDIAAQCDWNLLTGNKIVVDQKTWEGLDAGSRESLLFHELGHCVLNRQHVADLVGPGDPGSPPMATSYPKSLMHPSFVDGATYLALKDYYLKELFSN